MVKSIAMDGQSIGSKVAAAVTHNSNSQQVLGRGARLGLGSRCTRYTVGGHTANTDTRVISGGRRGSVVLSGASKAEAADFSRPSLDTMRGARAPEDHVSANY